MMTDDDTVQPKTPETPLTTVPVQMVQRKTTSPEQTSMMELEEVNRGQDADVDDVFADVNNIFGVRPGSNVITSQLRVARTTVFTPMGVTHTFEADQNRPTNTQDEVKEIHAEQPMKPDITVRRDQVGKRDAGETGARTIPMQRIKRMRTNPIAHQLVDNWDEFEILEEWIAWLSEMLTFANPRLPEVKIDWKTSLLLDIVDEPVTDLEGIKNRWLESLMAGRKLVPTTHALATCLRLAEVMITLPSHYFRDYDGKGTLFVVLSMRSRLSNNNVGGR